MKQDVGLSRGVDTNLKTIKYFVILEVIFYFSFLLLDSINEISAISTLLKFISITGCFIFVFISFIKNKENGLVLMLAILSFTVLADIFLLFYQKYETGILAFIIVQILYSLEIKRINKDNCKKYMLEVLTVVFTWNIVILILKNKNLLTPTVVIASLYFIIFSMNVIKSWIVVVRNKNRSAFELNLAFGLLLFYLCDINVALNNVDAINVGMPGVFATFAKYAGVLMWFFYLPSQVILSINSVYYNEEMDY